MYPSHSCFLRATEFEEEITTDNPDEVENETKLGTMMLDTGLTNHLSHVDKENKNLLSS